MTLPQRTVETFTEPLAPFEIHVENGRFAARDALSQFLEAISPLNLDVDKTGTIELVLAETINNIVEHAYPPGTPSGGITINCMQQDDGLAVRITDHGAAMPDHKLPMGELSSLDVELDELPEGGFGWFMILSLAQDVTYQRVGAENRLKMRLSLGLDP